MPSFFPTSYTAGAGTFPASVAAADFQGLGDGNVDFAVANIGNNTVSVFLNNHDGSGTFQPPVNYPVASQPVDIVAGDVDGDGLPDLVVSNADSNTVTVLYNDPANPGTFQPRVGLFATGGSGPRDVRLADLNGDGFPDVIVANSGNNTVGVLLNRGNGNFAPARTYPAGIGTSGAYALAVADFDGDGNLDVAVSNPGTTLSILRGNGDGTLQNFRALTNPGTVTGLAAGDLNGDGAVDLVATNNVTAGGVSVLLNNGNGTFQPPRNYATGANPLRVELADLNGDGNLDAVTVNILSNPGTVSVLYGNGDGTFQPALNFDAGGARPSGVAVADVEGDSAVDGRNDLIVTHNITTGDVAVLINTPAPVVVSTTLTGVFNNQTVSEGDVVFSDPIDLNTFVFDYDEFSLVDPNGRPVRVNSITATDDTHMRFHVTFTPQSTLGDYTLTIGPDIFDPTDQYRMPAPFVSHFTITNNLLVNGGFETGDFTGWTQSGDTSFTGVDNAANIPVHSGNFAAFFGPLNLGFISQTVTTVPGQTYQLSLWLSHPFSDTGTEFLVQIGGTTVDDQTNVGNFGYTQFTYSYTATGTRTVIQLGFLEPPSFFYLDDVNFTPIGDAGQGGGARFPTLDIANALTAAPGPALVPVSSSRLGDSGVPGRQPSAAGKPSAWSAAQGRSDQPQELAYHVRTVAAPSDDPLRGELVQDVAGTPR